MIKPTANTRLDITSIIMFMPNAKTAQELSDMFVSDFDYSLFEKIMSNLTETNIATNHNIDDISVNISRTFGEVPLSVILCNIISIELKENPKNIDNSEVV
jgi:hypothetical protein